MYPYFGIVVGLAWLNDPKSYACGSVATGRAFHARQVKGDNPDKKGVKLSFPGKETWHRRKVFSLSFFLF
jgi:hypothetical protein